MTFSLKSLAKYKYIFLLAACALILLLLPGGGSGQAGDSLADGDEARLEYVLGEISGAGRVSVLCSEQGAAVVCDGADDARVRLAIVEAVSAYTGLGSDRIKVLEMAQ